jgi:hypothetical protein
MLAIIVQSYRDITAQLNDSTKRHSPKLTDNKAWN